MSPPARSKQRAMLVTWFVLVFASVILRPWRRKRHIPPKTQLTFNGLQGIISEKTELYVTRFYFHFIWQIHVSRLFCLLFARFTLRLWWWRQYDPSKHQWTSTNLHGITSQKTVLSKNVVSSPLNKGPNVLFGISCMLCVACAPRRFILHTCTYVYMPEQGGG
jgi:hypothetical protein